MSRHAHNKLSPYEHVPTAHDTAVRSRLMLIGSVIEYLNQAAQLVDPGIDQVDKQPPQGQRLPLYAVEAQPFVPVAPVPYQPVPEQPNLSVATALNAVEAAHAGITDPGQTVADVGGTVIEAPFGQPEPYMGQDDGIAA